jgi:hypothetical protein
MSPAGNLDRLAAWLTALELGPLLTPKLTLAEYLFSTHSCH